MSVRIDSVSKNHNNKAFIIHIFPDLDEYPQKDCAIEIYFAKAGENTWDIAKKLNIKEELLYNQNPDLKEILEKDEKLAIYYKLEK